MQNFKRKITYFREHHKGVVGSTAGFMKLEIRGDKVKIIINIQEPMEIPYDRAALYLYHEAGDHLSAVKVDTVESINGVLTYQNRTDWQNIFRTERDLYTFDGVAVVYNDTHYYIGDFKDRDRSRYELVKKDRKPTVVTMEHDLKEETESLDVMRKVPNSVEEVKEEEKLVEVAGMAAVKKEVKPDSAPNQEEKVMLCHDCPYQQKRAEKQQKVDPFEEMIEKYPKLPMYGMTELFDCVRIHPRDIGKLDMRNWKLGVNSFLSHGFYTYQYLLLGKMRFEDGTYQGVIGVPGVYSNRERYLANMFGFEQFVPVKQTGVKTGEFGYWIIDVIPGL